MRLKKNNRLEYITRKGMTALVPLFCLVSLLSGSLVFSDVYYIDDSATGSDTGLSWSDAFNTIQEGVEAASSDGGGELWVAEGVYSGLGGEPERNGNSLGECVVVLAEQVHLYGGFKGDETSREARNWNQNQSIIDGESDRRCVFGADDSTLDGFHFQHGHSLIAGGGIYNYRTSPVIENCTFTNNFSIKGGGIYGYYSSSLIQSCSFSDNYGSLSGGGIYSYGGSPSVLDCSLIGNIGGSGTGVYSEYSEGRYLNCQFMGNISSGSGGGIYCKNKACEILLCSFIDNNVYGSGGGICTNGAASTINSCLFRENQVSAYGAGVYAKGSSSPTILNCLFLDHRGAGESALYCSSYSTSKVYNCILWGNDAGIACDSNSELQVSYSCVQGGYEGEQNIAQDPMLSYEGYLLPESPCRNTGTIVEEYLLDEDLLGNPRLQNNAIDMGPYEFNPSVLPSTLRVGLGPDNLSTDRPQWRLNGGDWIDSGDTISIYPGEYKIDFTSFVNWLDPAVETVTIDSNEIEKSFLYTRSPGKHRWYVDINAGGGNDGTSWGDAFSGIASAIEAAANDGFGEVWVAEGVYINELDHSDLELQEGVQLYGGFKGGESLLSQRDWECHEVVIDGEGGYPYHVKGADNAILDGFIVRNMRHTPAMTNRFASPIVANCIFEGGDDSYYGGGMCNRCSSPWIINCTFRNNFADNGGGICNLASSSPIIEKCLFENNCSYYGSCIYNYTHSSPVFDNCVFVVDDTCDYGYCILNSSTTLCSLMNCTIVRTEEDQKMTPVISPYSCLTNCIVWGGRRSEILEETESLEVTYSCIQGGYPGEGNISADPWFLSPSEGNYKLIFGSPCINSGTENGAPSTDYLGFPRFLDSGVDMGAFEHYDSPVSLDITFQLLGYIVGNMTNDCNGDGLVDAADLVCW